jgi:ABC-type multidrug transport system ATPase subunit/ABC-type multidrug transport system permease subunit
VAQAKKSRRKLSQIWTTQGRRRLAFARSRAAHPFAPGTAGPVVEERLLTTTCSGCSGRVAPGDRTCFGCGQVLVVPKQEALREVAPLTDTHAAMQVLRNPVVATAVPEVPSVAVDTPVENTVAAHAPPLEPLHLDVVWGRERSAIVVTSDGTTLGSGREADIRTSAPFLAGVHVDFHARATGWSVRALAPEAVILQQGRECAEAELEPGQTLRIADAIGNFVTLRVSPGTRPAVRQGALRALLPQPGESFLVGSDATCAVRLQHPLVEPRHAAFRCDDAGSLWIEDRKTAAGSYVNGRRLRGRQRLAERDVIQIGPFSATIGSTALEPLDQVAGVDIHVSRASVVIARGNTPRTVLRDVDLHLAPASLTAVVGPSGAGKSTLMKLLAGQLVPATGAITYNGVDLDECRQQYAALSGFVPQDDVVHVNLTVAEALDYQARLRLGDSHDGASRLELVDKLVAMIGLSAQRTQLVRTLSGGQRKRVSIACELLKEPQLLFLDEPTSGLDPGLDKRMMLLLRLLADQGRTVVLTTHAIAHVDVCDNLVLVGTGGRILYSGPPGGAAEAFGVASIGDVFAAIQPHNDSGVRQDEASPEPAGRAVPAPRRAPVAISHPDYGSAVWRRAVAANAQVFARRHLTLLVRDHSSTLFTLLQGAAVALMTALVAPRPFAWSDNGSSVVFVFGCAAVWFGMISSVRELVEERTIWRREYLAGANVHAYLAAKVGVLAVLGALQALILTVVLALTLGVPSDAPLVTPFLAILASLWLANVAGMSLGLVVSAGARTVDRAISLVPYLLVAQLVLCGVLFKLGSLEFLSWLVPARWAVSAVGGVAGLSPEGLGQSSGLYPESGIGLAGTWLMLVVLAVAALAGALWWSLRLAHAWGAGQDDAEPLLAGVLGSVRRGGNGGTRG